MQSKVAELQLIGDQKRKAQVFLAKFGTQLRDAQSKPLAASLVDLEKKLGIVGKNSISNDPRQLKDLVSTVRQMFGGLTIEDLTQAVYLLLGEGLQASDRKTLRPSGHFQNLSIAFVCEWLNAYKRYKMQAVKEIKGLLPYEFEEKTPEQIEEIELNMRETADQAFAEFKEFGGGFWSYAYPEVYQFLEDEEIYQLDNTRKWHLYELAKGNVNARVKRENDKNALKIAAHDHHRVIATEQMYKREARKLACIAAFKDLDAKGIEALTK